MKCYKIKALSEFHFQLLDSVQNSKTKKGEHRTYSEE